MTQTPIRQEKPTAVVTGASEGIGRATAVHLANAGFFVIGVARQTEKLEELAREIQGEFFTADLSQERDVDSLTQNLLSRFGKIDVLVNNAGGAIGLSPLEQTPINDWQKMWDINVKTTLLVTQKLLPLLRAASNSHIITITSTAALAVYPGGGGYNAAKAAQSFLSQSLRAELFTEPIRVCEICPGMVKTDFSLHRFNGDQARAAAVYEGLEPLTPEDIGSIVTFIASLPHHVNIDKIIVKPRDQLSFDKVFRSQHGKEL